MKTTLESLRITKFKYDNFFVSKGTRFTLEYLIKIVEKLKPMDKSTENRVLEKLLSFLTHQWVTISDSMANSTDSWSMSTRNSDVVDEDHHWGTMKLGMSAKLYAFVRNIQQKLASNSTSWPRNSSELIFFLNGFLVSEFVMWIVFLIEFFFAMKRNGAHCNIKLLWTNENVNVLQMILFLVFSLLFLKSY